LHRALEAVAQGAGHAGGPDGGGCGEGSEMNTYSQKYRAALQKARRKVKPEDDAVRENSAAMRAATTPKDYRRPNMTTDEMILELVETGKFTLPPDVVKVFDPVDKCECFALDMKGMRTGKKTHVLLSNQQAHDLCAMHFAREMKSWTDKERAPAFHRGFTVYMHDGDSAAAIKALYEAVCKEAK
jgi:hypothetical protein